MPTIYSYNNGNLSSSEVSAEQEFAQKELADFLSGMLGSKTAEDRIRDLKSISLMLQMEDALTKKGESGNITSPEKRNQRLSEVRSNTNYFESFCARRVELKRRLREGCWVVEKPPPVVSPPKSPVKEFKEKTGKISSRASEKKNYFTIVV